MNENTPVKNCGLIIGAFKPYTAGHHFLITKALEENDLVLVSVSQKDRKRKNEMPITWEKMKQVWENYIAPKLPEDVIVCSTDNPIVSLFNFLKTQDDKNPALNKTIFNLYMDDKDQKRYCYQEHEIEKKFPNLYKNNQIKIKTFSRKDNIDVSATKARKQLQDKNLAGFIETLPEELKESGPQIYNILLS